MDYKWTALTVTTIGTLMAGIDGRITAIGLPTIAQQLHASADDVVWITQAYALALTLDGLLIGRLSDLYGRVKLYNVGFIIFTLGSAFATLSPGPYQLIASRLFQGAGAGILITNSSVIVTDASPTKELGTMLGINQTAFRAGNVIGLTVAGIILAIVDWRGLFYVNIPIGIFGIVWAHRRLREITKQEETKKMDWLGFALFSSGLALILLSITFLSYGLAGSLQGYGLLAVGTALLALFFRVESRSTSPLLDLRLFKIRQFGAGNVAQLLNSLTWAGVILLLSFYLQIGLGYTPLQAGLGILPLDVTYLISSFVSGRLSDRHGTRLLTTVGLGINALSFAAISTFGGTTPYLVVALVMVAIGVGNGMFTSPNLRAIMSSVPTNRRGTASGFRNTVFTVGSTTSFGLVLLFITIGAPYGTLSSLLQGTLSGPAMALATADFLNGFRIATLLMAVIVGAAIIPSAMRGKKEDAQQLASRPEPP